MKILDISLKNLNSLRGEWHIDLTNSSYISDGIFAITGPTGAGKTTIFDAICLALYGQTPRLGRVGGQSNEIMSRQTNECYARVIFETQSGRYICLWSQKRIGRSNQFQPANHSISEFTGKILASSLTTTRTIVEEITGMDFRRFTQAMMLEQGGFDAFLSADKNDRAAVLELITGTEIYSKISSMVYERSQDEANLLRDKNKELELTRSSQGDMNEESITSELERMQSELSRLSNEHKSTEAARDLLREIKRLTDELSRNDEDIAAQRKRIDAFEADRKKLDAAERAATLESDYTRLVSERRARASHESECVKMRDSISASEAEVAKIVESVPAMNESLSRVRGSLKEAPEVVMLRIKTAVDNLAKAENEQIQSQKMLDKAEYNMKRAQEASNRVVQSGKIARAKKDEAERNHSDLFNQIMSMRARTASAVFAEARAELQPGAPCPVCGSREHPGVAHDEAVHEKSDVLFVYADRLKTQLDRLEIAVREARENFDRAVNNWNKASAAEAEARKGLSAADDDLLAKKEKTSSCRSELNEAVMPLGLAGLSSQEIISRVNAWSDRVRQLEERIQASETRKCSLEAGINTAKNNLALRTEELSALIRELEGLEASFIGRLSTQNFLNENDFVSALQYTRELPALRSRWQELTERMNFLLNTRETVKRKLDDKTANNPTTAELEETEALFKRQESEILNITGKISVMRQKLETVKNLQARINELSRAAAEQKTIADNWAAFSGLIGSAKGDKFRVFAQKITLDLVVNNANLYLKKMNGRYLLKSRPNSDKLELSVIDNDQAGEIRPTENLSGGERFIVSLALALGLSQISGSKARVDSVFLDEGFGSLDEESLNTALEALGEVKREGRMIGIISHIDTLRERIAAQIRVIPKTEGMSVIDGPGCSRVS